MFGFLRSRNDPLADARSAQRWLAAATASDSLARHEVLLGELARATAPNAELTPRRLAALFVLDSHAKELFDSLTTQYVEHAARSAKIERQLWSALFDLTRRSSMRIRSIRASRSTRKRARSGASFFPSSSAARSIHLGRDARVRLYRYESWIPGKWAELHQLLSLATSRQIERLPVLLARDRPATTIEHQYLMVLVLQLMDTGNLTPRQIEELWDELGNWCATLRLSLTAKTPTTFYVDLAGREGLKRRGPHALEGSVLFVDTHPLHALLTQNQVELEQKIRDKPRSEETARRAEELGLLQRIAAKVDPEFQAVPAPAASGSPRTAASTPSSAWPRSQASCAKRSAIPSSSSTQARASAARSSSPYSDACATSTIGASELARHRLAQYAAAGGAWEVKDMSKTGFRLIAPMQAANAFPIGTLVAIRPHGESAWTLGIVRRMRRHTSERTEIGMQMIASTLSGVDLVEQRKSSETRLFGRRRRRHRSTAEASSRCSSRCKKRAEQPGVQSLIVPASEYVTGKRLTLVTARSIYRVVLGGPIEQQPDWVWTAVEPQEIGTKMGAPSGAHPSPPH